MEEGEGEVLKELKRFNAWLQAALEHASSSPESAINLADGAKAWREMEAANPAWRETEPTSVFETPEQLEAEARRRKAQTFEEQCKKALREPDHNFFRRLAKALLIPPEKIALSLSVKGAIVLAWKELDGLTGRPPTKRKVRSWVEARMRENNTPLPDDRSWRRIWEDPFIAALWHY